MHSTPARTAHRGRAALIGWFKALMTVAGIVLSCWAPVVGASAVTAAPAACQVPAEASDGSLSPLRSSAAQRTVAIVTAALAGYRIPDDRIIDAVRMTRASLHGFVDIEVHGGFAMNAPIDVSFATLVDSLDAALVALGEQ